MTDSTTQLTVFPNMDEIPMIKGEKIRHRNAFELYCRMGQRRSLRGLEEILKTGKGSVRVWSQKFKWAERVEKFDQDIKLLMSELTKEDIIAKNKEHIEIIDEAIKQWKDKLNAGEINLNMVQDIEKLLNIRAKLSGQEALTTENQNNIQVNVNFV